MERNKHEACLKWLLYHVKIVVPFRSSSNESKNYYYSKMRMNIHTKQIKPHKKQMSVAQVIIVSLTLIKFSVTILYIKE